MENSELNTETIILEAAEAEFLEKGYGNAKVLSIAKRAGVSHSMLHYYFRSKEKLFQTVFESKVEAVGGMFEDIFNQKLSFDQTIRLVMETQFNFLSENPKLPYFILTEVISNKSNRELLIRVFSSRSVPLAKMFREYLESEIESGRVRKISFEELIMNIISVNVFTFLAMPVLLDVLPIEGKLMSDLLAMRRESNVQFILNSLRP